MFRLIFIIYLSHGRVAEQVEFTSYNEYLL